MVWHYMTKPIHRLNSDLLQSGVVLTKNWGKYYKVRHPYYKVRHPYYKEEQVLQNGTSVIGK